VDYPLEYLLAHPEFIVWKLEKIDSFKSRVAGHKEWILTNLPLFEIRTRRHIKKYYEECNISAHMLEYVGW
jgi:hypothetical protein